MKISRNNLLVRIEDELEVVEGQWTASYSIMCMRGDCSDCILSWTGPAQVHHTVTGENLPLFAQGTTFSRYDSGKFECMAKNFESNKELKATFQLIVQCKFLKDSIFKKYEKTQSVNNTKLEILSSFIRIEKYI